MSKMVVLFGGFLSIRKLEGTLRHVGGKGSGSLRVHAIPKP